MQWELLFIEAMFQLFRREHGIGNGLANRQKFLRIFPQALQRINEASANGRIKVVSG
jgi:hypothetical protein